MTDSLLTPLQQQVGVHQPRPEATLHVGGTFIADGLATFRGGLTTGGGVLTLDSLTVGALTVTGNAGVGGSLTVTGNVGANQFAGVRGLFTFNNSQTAANATPGTGPLEVGNSGGGAA